MARPLKTGLDYFPLDVRIFRDEKLRVLSYLGGPLAEIVYIRILTMIYENGYYLEYTIDNLARVLHIDIGPQWHRIERISECINFCLEAGLFDKSLAVQGVITAESVQKQYLLSTVRRKDINIDKYWLLKPSESVRPADGSLSVSKENDNVNNNLVNVNNNQVNANISTQSKSKSKKDKLINIDKRAFDEPKLHFITKALVKNKYVEEGDLLIGKYNMLAEKLVDAYGFDMVLAVSDYIMKMFRKDHINILDRYNYFKTSAERNLKALAKRNEGGNFDIEKELKKLAKEMGFEY